MTIAGPDNRRGGRACFIQSHHTDIRGDDLSPKGYSVDILKESGMFDSIVIAGADLPENQFLLDIAESWGGVECLLGSVNNMVKRMLEISRSSKTEVVTRVLLDWFFIDTELVRGMVEMLEREELDYVNLPYDFDIKFGADVHSTKGLEQVAVLFKECPNLAETHRFRPWFLMEENPFGKWLVGTYQNVPTNSNDYFHQLRKEMKRWWPVAWDFGQSFYYHTYMYAREHIHCTDVVLDIACGWGDRTVILAEKCAKVIGIDISMEYIQTAQKRYLRENLQYLVSDAMDISLPRDSVDVAISAHTMEHIEDDEKFLSEVSRVLKRDGKFIIGVPLRIRRPFVFNSEPFMPDHIREYEIGQLTDLIGRHFHIQAGYGVNRGNYCDLSKARNAAMFVCKQGG